MAKLGSRVASPPPPREAAPHLLGDAGEKGDVPVDSGEKGAKGEKGEMAEAPSTSELRRTRALRMLAHVGPDVCRPMRVGPCECQDSRKAVLVRRCSINAAR